MYAGGGEGGAGEGCNPLQAAQLGVHMELAVFLVANSNLALFFALH